MFKEMCESNEVKIPEGYNIKPNTPLRKAFGLVYGEDDYQFDRIANTKVKDVIRELTRCPKNKHGVYDLTPKFSKACGEGLDSDVYQKIVSMFTE